MYLRRTLALVLSAACSIGCSGAKPPVQGAAPRAPAALRVPMVLVDAEARAGLPMVSTVRADQAYELCTLGGDPVARRDCYMLTVDAAGQACGSLQQSIDGHVVAKCTPPSDCKAVTKRFRAAFGSSRWTPPGYQPALSSARPTKLTLVMPDWHSTPASPSWVDVSMDYDEAPDDARALVRELAELCR